MDDVASRLHAALMQPTTAPASMARYWAAVVGLLALLLALFAVVEALGVRPLTDPAPLLAERSPQVALVGVALLVADVAMPVPSSLVMVAHGALFGVAAGTALSLAGGVGAALTGFAIGRRGGPLLARLVTDAQKQRADALLHRWGVLAIVVTRPVPLLAEAVAILAGTSRLPWAPVALAAVVGTLPPALLYALTGAVAASFGNAALMFAVVLAVAAAMWLVAAGWTNASQPRPPPTVQGGPKHDAGWSRERRRQHRRSGRRR